MKAELAKLGLSPKEIEVYLACLKAGESTANRLAELTGFARSTTYDILEKLKHGGFISTITKKNKTHFIAKGPRALITSLIEQEKEMMLDLERKRKAIKNIAPALAQMKGEIVDKPSVKLFRGQVSISRLLDEIAESGHTIKIIGNQMNAVQQIDYRTDRFRMKRKEQGVVVYQLLEESKEARKEKNRPLYPCSLLKQTQRFERRHLPLRRYLSAPSAWLRTISNKNYIT